MPSPRVAVIGGGVNGIGSSIAVLQRYPQCELTVYAEEVTPNTTGDGAAGLWTPFLLPDTSPNKIIKWSKATWDLLFSWWKAGDHSILLMYVETISKGGLPDPEWKHIPFGFEPMRQDDLKKYGNDYTDGYKYSAFVAEPNLFLPHLYKLLMSLGGKIIQRKVKTLYELAEEADVIINCSGLGSYDLVPDHNSYPIRGQVYRVIAPFVTTVVLDETEDSSFSYIIPTTNSVVLGGTHQEDDWRRTVDKDDSQKIWRNCLKVMPNLKNAKIVKEWVGLRPGRRGGVRLEREDLETKFRVLPVVHNYGHGGSGVTLFWGCAQEVSDIVGEILEQRHAVPNNRSKL